MRRKPERRAGFWAETTPAARGLRKELSPETEEAELRVEQGRAGKLGELGPPAAPVGLGRGYILKGP